MIASDTRSLKKLLQLMTTVGKETGHSDITLHQIKVLLFVALRDAQDDPADSREISGALQLSTSGVSRALASLGDYGRGGRGGLGLIELRVDPNDRRRKPVMLSRKGLKVMAAILEAADIPQLRSPADVREELGGDVFSASVE
ncbi:MarR family winged helix-turn-helix transcriptional regulator [uncultured Microbulbifer sp.]|uniref:MarR family winged helix-turn-helix transcriptional regulator n=1 Tax=uncultured Microbulbifer sp. TaxID=348147 RepID=UPI0025DA164C|nr:MarR family winged helix-turn-helix transcriptional regulator [uncultured Microbulbifer sp.]